MNPSNIVIVLSSLVALLALVAAGIGYSWRNGGGPRPFTTLRGQTAQIQGEGLYRYDTVFFGAGFRGQDAVVLFLGVPLLVLSILVYHSGSLGGPLLLTGTLGYFLYVYASMALGAAYNRLFLVYVALFSASLFAFVLTFASVYLEVLEAHISSDVPRLPLAIFMFVGGLVTLVVWGAPLLQSLRTGGPPDRLDSYTTPVTYALDLAIITPATFICGALVLQDAPLGYLMAFLLLTIIIMLAPQITLSTLYQKRAGVPFTTAEMIGPVAGFALLGLIAIWLIVNLMGSIAGFF
jgi:hypothetical protein